jgi:hypothetical protein
MSREKLAQGGSFTVFFRVSEKTWHPLSVPQDGGDGSDDKGYAARVQPEAADAGECLVRLLAAGAHEDVVDFDCHLDDVSLDVFNPSLADKIKA